MLSSAQIYGGCDQQVCQNGARGFKKLENEAEFQGCRANTISE